MKTIDILKFWQTKEMVEVTGHSEILTDRFAIDFNNHGVNPGELKFISKQELPLETMLALKNPRNELEISCERVYGPFNVYVFYSRSRDTTMAQKQYCEYFQNVYPGCVFKAKRRPGFNPVFPYIAVHHKGKLVGGIAAIR